MLLEIVEPTVEKKWLKVLAIAFSSDDNVPLMLISVILPVFFARLAASLSIVQVFFEHLELDRLSS
jgi:hypothetical protein